MYGRVMRRKVCHSPAPRSLEASSSARSKPAMRARTTIATNGKQNATWPITIGPRLSGQGSAGRPAGAHEEREQRDAHADLGDHDRQRHRALERGLAGEAEAPQRQREQRADHGADRGRDQRDGDAVGERLDQRRVVPGLGVVVEREALPDDVAPGIVEAEQRSGSRSARTGTRRSRPARRAPRTSCCTPAAPPAPVPCAPIPASVRSRPCEAAL